MYIQELVDAGLIGVGAFVLLGSLVRAKTLRSFLPFVAERNRVEVARMLAAHRMLMRFFLLGYLLVLLARAWGYTNFSGTLVSLIFMVGAVYVFISIVVQARLLAEMQGTLQGILPICSRCKRIREPDDNPEDPKAWKVLEEFMSDHTRVNFSHGYCPSCQEQELKRINGP